MKSASLAVLCLAASIFLATAIEARSHTAGGPEMASDPLFLAMGSAKEAIGDTLFLRADEYFHGGFIDRDHPHEESAEEVEKEGLIHPEEGEYPHGDWIEGINRQIRATQERHLEKDKRKEMLPFFKWATDLDPHNIEAVLTTAFWLDREFNKPEEARAVLEKGVRDNPSSWELESEYARSLLKAGDRAASETHLQAAIAKSADANLDDFQRRALENRIKELSVSA